MTVVHQLSICVVVGLILLSNQWVLASPLNSSTSDWTHLNIWQETSEWKCNTPLVKDDLTLTLYRSEPESEEKFLLLYGGSISTTRLSDETWSFSLQSKVWSRLPAQRGTERPSGRKFHTMTTLCGATVLMFGGKGKGGKAMNDSWIFESHTEIWKRPAVISDLPVPALFRHAALAVHDPYSSCSCKQSVLVLSDQSCMWSDLWQIRCVEDREIYKWRKIEFDCNATCKGSDPAYNSYAMCPIKGKAGLSVSIVNEGIVIAIATNGLWKYEYLQHSWTLLQRTDSSGIAPFKRVVTSSERAVYMPHGKRYIIFGGIFESDIISYSVDMKKWERKSALEDNPMASLAAVVDGNTTIAYGGTSATGCHQYLKTLVRTESTWVWIRNFTVPVQPNLAPQLVLGVWKNRLYVSGKSVRQQQKTKYRLSEMWKFNTINMQWWKVGSLPEAGQSFCGSSRDYYRSVLFHDNRFVVYGYQYFQQSPDLHIYWISNNTWQTQTTRLAPQPRRYHSMSSYTETVAFLFGGGFKCSECSNCLTALNDLWMLQSKDKTLEWIPIHNNSKTRNYPAARTRHAMVIIGTRIYLYSGYDTYNQVLKDLWQYNILRDSWKVVETVNLGPVTLSLYLTLLATTVGNQMIMTLGCFDKLSKLMQFDRCNITKPQETWIYSPENKRWTRVSSTQILSDVFGARSGPSTPLMYDQGSLMLLNVINVLDRARVYYMAFACPEGYYSSHTISKPCRLCPIGKYSDLQRTNCQNCPNQLTTTSSGMHSINQCSKCAESYCTYGKCLVVRNITNGFPGPQCECTFGFTGDHCDYPTYYLITVGLVILVTGAALLVVRLVNAAKRKQIRERNLTTQVEELLSVWQIKHEELTLMDMIGVGAFGKVYKSEYREAVVAVKVLNVPEELDTLNEVAQEIRFLQTIRHPNVVMFIGAGKTGHGCSFLVTEFVPRGSLRDVLDNESVSLTLPLKLHLAIGAAKGLNFLHTLTPPRIHRDVKSANLLVSQKWMVKVADFGLCRQIVPQRRQRSNSSASNRETILNPLLGVGNDFTHRVGTVKWRAPELSTTESYDTAVDVYRYAHNNNDN